VERLEGTVKLAVALLALVVLASCGVDRTGWGHGKLVVVREGPALQVRRSTIRVEEQTGDLVMNWIGVRVPPGAKPLAEASVTAFDDRDGDGIAQPGEILFRRACADQTDKILFSDLRLRRDETRPGVRLLVQVRRRDGHVLEEQFPFEPD
jgi:hypothetical protein